jgi:hypothetical protein
MRRKHSSRSTTALVIAVVALIITLLNTIILIYGKH